MNRRLNLTDKLLIRGVSNVHRFNNQPKQAKMFSYALYTKDKFRNNLNITRKTILIETTTITTKLKQ